MHRPAPDPWRRVEQLVVRAPSVEALRIHGVELIAARTLLAGGRPLPAALQRDRRGASIRSLAVPTLLEKVRAAYAGRVMVMKGPEVAARYPEPQLRPFKDLDLLVDDAAAAQRALVAAGFIELVDPTVRDGVHHGQPVAWPGLPLTIELHNRTKHAPWLQAPPTEEILAWTEPSAVGPPGILAPIPAAHAVLLAAHSWSHEPLRRLLDLIDIAVILEDDQRDSAAGFARRWDLDRVWSATIACVDALLYDERPGLILRLFGRHLVGVRERTVLETHLARWIGPAVGVPRHGARAVATATRAFTGAAHPRPGESWPKAMQRTALAAHNAFRTQSQHDRIRELGAGR